MAKAPKKVKRSWRPERVAFQREIDNSEFYNSWKWRKKAKAYKESNPLCVHCQREGIITAVYVVDHIVPINSGGEQFDDLNLQSLCEMHHNKKSASERGGYGVKSR